MKHMIWLVISLASLTILVSGCITFRWAEGWENPAAKKYLTSLVLAPGESLPLVWNQEAVYVRGTSPSDPSLDGFFVLDTGSWGNLWDKRFLPPSVVSKVDQKVLLSALLGGKGLNEHPHQVESLVLGGVRPVPLWFQPVDWASIVGLSSPSDKPLLGLIGLPLLQDRPFVLSFSESRVESATGVDGFDGLPNLYTDQESWWRGALQVPVLGKLEGERTGFRVDTGSNRSFLGTSLALEQARRHPERWILIQRQGGGRSCCGYPYDLIVNGLRLDDTFFYSNANQTDDSTLGMPVISLFDWLVDLPQKRVVAKLNGVKWPYPDSDQSLDQTVGFEMNHKDDWCRVVALYFWNGQPLIADLKIGDELVLINGTPPKDYDWSQWYSTQHFVFEVKSSNRTYTLERTRQTYRSILRGEGQ